MNVLCIAVGYIGCEMQLALPSARITLDEKTSACIEMQIALCIFCLPLL